MIYLFEFNSFYQINDIVLIHYWYNNMITPVKIVDRKGKKFIITHNIEFSKIKNAPNESIYKKDILDKFKG